MISSGRSFTVAPSSRGSRALGAVVRGGRARWRRRAASRPGGRCRRSGSGSTLRVASTRAAGGAARSGSTIAARLVVGELVRGRQLDGRAGPRSRRPAARTRAAISSTSPLRPFSASRRRKLRTSSSAAAGDRLERRGLRARVELRVAQHARAARAPPRPPRRSRRAPPGPPDEPAVLRGGLVERARVRCGGRPPCARRVSLSSTEKSSSPIASSIRRRWSSSVEDLAGHLRGRLERQVGDLGADLLERALRLGLDLACASPRARRCAVGLGLLLQRARAARRRPCAPRRGSPPPRRAPARSAPGAPRAACAPRRGRGRPRRSTGGSARAARRSPSGSGRTRTA